MDNEPKRRKMKSTWTNDTTANISDMSKEDQDAIANWVVNTIAYHTMKKPWYVKMLFKAANKSNFVAKMLTKMAQNRANSQIIGE